MSAAPSPRPWSSIVAEARMEDMSAEPARMPREALLLLVIALVVLVLLIEVR